MTKIALLHIENGRVLMCRKKTGTSGLILPGGKLEEGETDLACLAREVSEELNVAIADAVHIETFGGFAASDGSSVRQPLTLVLYSADVIGQPVPSAEIAELVWFGPDDDRAELTDMSKLIISELLLRRFLGAEWMA